MQECLRSGRAFPNKIAGAPSLMLGLELYYDAFLELDSCREVGWSVGPIPWSTIRDYAETFEFDAEQYEDLYYYVRAMDNAFLERQRKLSAPKGKK